ncbi:putative uncharacterized protein DDB_G0281733 [Mercenaria mercenaria]|uniref:putative uncharacterized protein DDB_G0281733 n=1 Tax=Mercenaria mercenaria TaxID=6596 RepID=UPI00234E5A6A|nr:putative uncharacterized protein DDB_G0281733 [Mercenaria mercenaria]
MSKSHAIRPNGPQDEKQKHKSNLKIPATTSPINAAKLCNKSLKNVPLTPILQPQAEENILDQILPNQEMSFGNLDLPLSIPIMKSPEAEPQTIKDEKTQTDESQRKRRRTQDQEGESRKLEETLEKIVSSVESNRRAIQGVRRSVDQVTDVLGVLQKTMESIRDEIRNGRREQERRGEGTVSYTYRPSKTEDDKRHNRNDNIPRNNKEDRRHNPGDDRSYNRGDDRSYKKGDDRLHKRNDRPHNRGNDRQLNSNDKKSNNEQLYKHNNKRRKSRDDREDKENRPSLKSVVNKK